MLKALLGKPRERRAAVIFGARRYVAEDLELVLNRRALGVVADKGLDAFVSICPLVFGEPDGGRGAEAQFGEDSIAVVQGLTDGDAAVAFLEISRQSVFFNRWVLGAGAAAAAVILLAK